MTKGTPWTSWQDPLPLVQGGGLSAAPDWAVGGLVLAIAGCFLLANAILLREPRELIQERFGRREARLGSIRGYMFHRVQVSLGFLLLLLGFGLQLLGHVVGRAPAAETGASGSFPIHWVGFTIALVVVLEVLGWWISRALFQRYVRESLLGRESLLESDSRLAREIGELFGIGLEPDDTVQSYAARVRKRVHLPRTAKAPTPPGADLDEVLLQAEEGPA